MELAFGYPPVSLETIYHEHVADVLNSGHTIQINDAEGSTIDVEGPPRVMRGR